MYCLQYQALHYRNECITTPERGIITLIAENGLQSWTRVTLSVMWTELLFKITLLDDH